jgi:hypothetical protein
MPLIHVGRNEFGFPDARFLPEYGIVEGFAVKPGDILGRTQRGSLIEHRALIGFDGVVYHSPVPGDVFRAGWLSDVIAPGDRIRVVHPTKSWEETERRINRAMQILDVPWWNMNCHQTTDFIVGLRNVWLT